jgi:hypothetical protein
MTDKIVPKFRYCIYDTYFVFCPLRTRGTGTGAFTAVVLDDFAAPLTVRCPLAATFLIVPDATAVRAADFERNVMFCDLIVCDTTTPVVEDDAIPASGFGRKVDEVETVSAARLLTTGLLRFDISSTSLEDSLVGLNNDEVKKRRVKIKRIDTTENFVERGTHFAFCPGGTRGTGRMTFGLLVSVPAPTPRAVRTPPTADEDTDVVVVALLMVFTARRRRSVVELTVVVGGFFTTGGLTRLVGGCFVISARLLVVVVVLRLGVSTILKWRVG